MVFTRENLDWWCGRGILVLVLAMLAFAPLAFGAVDMWAFLVVQALALGVFALWAVRLWVDPRPKLLWPPLAWVVLAFIVYAAIRHLTADIEYIARLEFIQVVVFGFVFFAVVNNLQGQDEAEAITATLMVVGTGVACYAVTQLLQHSNAVWNMVSPYAGRASGTFISPNNLAGFLGMLLPLALAFLLVGKVSMITRTLLGYAALSMAAGLAVSFSRAGWVAAACGILLVLVILVGHGNHRWKAVLLLVVLIAAGGVFTTRYLSKTVGYMQRVATPGEEKRSVIDVTSRLDMWKTAGRMWQDHALFGVGPAHFNYRFREYRPENFQQQPDRVHNDYINLLVDWGVAGGVLVLVGMGIFVYHARKTWPHVRREENAFGSGQSNRFALFLGAVGGLTSLAVHSLMDFNLHIPANALLGVTLLALVTSNTRFATGQHWTRIKIPLKVALTLALMLVAVFLGKQEWQLAGETRWLLAAQELPHYSPEKAAALEKAFAAEPRNFQTAYEIGECYRTQSFDGGEDSDDLARRAIEWYARAIRVNPHDGYSFMRTGMCLDWIGKHDDAAKYFSQAELRDPNGCYMIAHIGWHYVQIGDYTAAWEWFVRSIRLGTTPIAHNYLIICEQKLLEKSSGQPAFPQGF